MSVLVAEQLCTSPPQNSIRAVGGQHSLRGFLVQSMKQYVSLCSLLSILSQILFHFASWTTFYKECLCFCWGWDHFIIDWATIAFYGFIIWFMHGHVLWLFLNLLRIVRQECNLVRVCIGALEYVICPWKHDMKTAFLFQLHCISCRWKFGGWRADFFFFFCSVMPMVVEWRLRVQHAEVTWVMFSRVRASKLPRMQGTVWTASLWSSPQQTSKSQDSSETELTLGRKEAGQMCRQFTYAGLRKKKPKSLRIVFETKDWLLLLYKFVITYVIVDHNKMD